MLKDKFAIVTGSTSGIGKAIATVFAKQGCGVMLNGLASSDQISSLQASMEKEYNVPILYSSADMSHPEDIEKMMESAIKAWGRVDIVVNNAGIQHVDPIENFPVEQWDKIIAINLSSAFHMIRHVLPSMRENKYGRIINIASAHGLVGSARKSAYVAAKHGIVGLTKVVALETAGSNITCNAICPGWVKTPLVEAQIELMKEKNNITYPEAQRKLLMEKQPSGEFIHAENIGDLCVFLCSDAARNLTGTALPLDGGWTAQ